MFKWNFFFTNLDLCAGIGVDDMFVITQCYDKLTHAEKELPMHRRIGLTLKHAGMSIFVTSLTDICAFGVGSTTVRYLFPLLYSCVMCHAYSHEAKTSLRNDRS